MGTVKNWRRVLGDVAQAVLEITGADPGPEKAPAESPPTTPTDVKGCTLCSDTQTPLLVASRGAICPGCVIASTAGLLTDWERQRELLRAFREEANKQPSIKEVCDEFQKSIATWQEALKAKDAEIDNLRQRAEASASRALAAAEVVRAKDVEIEALKKELATISPQASSGSMAPSRPTKLSDFQSFSAALETVRASLHPRIFAHFLSLDAESNASTMQPRILDLLWALLRAHANRMPQIEGPAREVLAALRHVGYEAPEHAAHLVPWLARRSPLLTTVMKYGAIYTVHLEWFHAPSEECLGELADGRR